MGVRQQIIQKEAAVSGEPWRDVSGMPQILP